MNRVVVNQHIVSWVIGSCDWGFVNPGVLQAWIVFADDHMCMVAEHYHTKKTIDWWIARALEMTDWFSVDEWACDPSEPAYIEQFKAAGLNAKPAINDIMPGVSAVQERLVGAGDGRCRLSIYENALLLRDEALVEAKLPWCTVQEIPEYVWAKGVGGETLKDKPMDHSNHGMDAMRYAAAQRDLLHQPGSISPTVAAAFVDLPR